MKKSVSLLSLTVVIACIAASNANADLLSLYTFDNTADNAVATAPNGTPVGSPGYVAGKLGQAISFNGSTQYVDCSTEGFPKTSVYGERSNGLWTGSLALWVNTTTSAASSTLLGAYNEGGNTGAAFVLNEDKYGYGATGNMKMVFHDEGRDSSYSIGLNNANDAWRDGSWHQVLFTWTQGRGAGADDYGIYIDGVSQSIGGDQTGNGFEASKGEHFAAWENPVRLGANGRGTAGDLLSGALDDVAVFNSKLTDAEAAGLFNLANSSLQYNAKDAAALFGVFAMGAGNSGNTSDGKTWTYTGGLSGNNGDLVSLTGGNMALILDAGGHGVTTGAPVPEPGTVSLLVGALVGLLAYAWRRRR